MESLQRTSRFLSSSSLRYTPSLSPGDCSFEFIEPSKRRFGLRKRQHSSESQCQDNVSVASLDLQQGKKRRLSRVASLASLVSPAKQIRKLAFGTRRSSPPPSTLARRSAGTPSRAFVKRSRQWLDKFPQETRSLLKDQMSYWSIRRQEAIYELYKGEKYMVKDLELVRQTYQGGLRSLGILQPEESAGIFGPLHTLLPVHRDLQDKLRSSRQQDDKITPSVGRILLEWVPQLGAYLDYCSHLVAAREMLESRRASCKELATFLDLCQQSGFSRRLDLWSFLDVPRSKLTKYPLLLKNILKHTCDPHEDRQLLPQVISKVESIIEEVDRSTGQAICRDAIGHIRGLDPQRDAFVADAKTLLRQGELRNARGTKLHGFLFDTGFVLTRATAQNAFRLHKPPIPASRLLLVQVSSSSKKSSFKSAFSSGRSGSSATSFCISDGSGEEEILCTGDLPDLKEWLQRLDSVSKLS